MPELITPEQHRAEVSALNREIYLLSKRLEDADRNGKAPEAQDPFRNPTEYHESRTDYSRIMPDIALMRGEMPLDPDAVEKKNLKRAYAVGGGCMLAHFIITDYIASAFMIAIMIIIKKLNPDADANVISTYIRSSSILAGIMLIVYLMSNVGFAYIGMRINKDDCRDFVRTRDFTFAKGVQYCLIGIFFLFVSTITAYFIEVMFSQFGHTTRVMETDGIGVSDIGKVVMLTYTCVIAPVTEEIFFRGMLLKAFGKANQRFAVFFTALMFGLAHANIPQFVLTFLLGIFLAHITLKHGSLIPAILVHFFVNTFSTVMSESGFEGNALIIANELFILFALLGGVMLIVFRTTDKLPATAPAQTRRGMGLAMATPIVLLSVILQTLYLLSFIFSTPMLDLIRNYL